ncbi:MAG: PAS domain-containing protein [Acidobacteria bacterium]|nr:PAS domain-containing protein [Acidobacteriota bacterium]
MTRRIFTFKTIATTLLTIGILILGGLNVEQKRIFRPPDDGCAWIHGSAGIEARLVIEGGPCHIAGIKEGDILRAINGRSITNDWQVTRILYEVGTNMRANYTIERDGKVFDLGQPVILAERVLREQLYLEIIGLLYFLVGIFVLLKRSRAPHALHFYFVCLAAFVFYVFHYTGKLNSFDWTIFWFDLGANILLPPLFLHFCLEFPIRHRWVKHRRQMLWLIYVPGTLLFAAHIAFVTKILASVPSLLVLRNLLDTLADFHFGMYFVLSAAVLVETYRTVQTPELRQQMKWVTRGTAVAVIPYFALSSVPRLFGALPPEGLTELAIFPLVLLPISFGYAIHRYRLMDVDIIFKVGVTYTLATASIIGVYVTFVVLVGELLGSGFDQSSFGSAVRVVITIIAALLFAPIKDQFQVWLDKVFYRDRYNLRQTLIDFGRTLGSEVHLENMLDRIVDRLGRALFVTRAAIFLEAPMDSSHFVAAKVSGLTIPDAADFSFLKTDSERPYIFFENEVHYLNYFIPCHVKDRVIAYIGLGRTQNGDYLTSEDLELLETVSDYIGIALENARLYRSLEQKANEYQSLKDFSENIIESINVGVVVEDVDGRIVGWNRALETLTGLNRAETLGRSMAEIIPIQFMQRLVENRHLYKQQWNGLTVNFSATALVDKSCATRGTMIIIDNITDRVRLEDQLIQNEKLTSVGLLAAGVAHEINTPLAVISSYSQMLRKEISPEDPRFKLLEKITKQTFRASEIVNNLLNFSRTNATEFAEVDVHQVITETLSLLEHQFKSARIRVERELTAEYPITFGNAGKLQQVFLNLFVNARDAMSDGGGLRVRTETVDSKLEIVVQDSGTGISRENIKKIYDPFFTTKAAGKGTGLGLSVSYGIVQEHGGNISVESRPGQGTSFKLELPLVRKTVNV